MRAAIVYHFYAHYRGPILRELVERGRHEYVLFGDFDEPGSGIRPWCPPPHVKIMRARCWYVSRYLLWQTGLVRLALRPDVDAVIYLGNAFWPATWVSAGIARARGKRVLFWTHGFIRRERGLRRWIRVAFYRLADALLLYGHNAKSICLAEGMSPDRLHVIYNSLDSAKQRQVFDAYGGDAEIDRTRLLLFRNTSPVVVCTSRLIRLRRLDLLMQAMALLRRRGAPSINLLLVGEGPERAALERLAAELNIPTCFYGEAYEEDEIGPLILAANVMVAPGKAGLTVMHAMGYGVPVVTHDDPSEQMPEFEAVIPGRTGSLFRSGDVESLAAAIGPWVDQERVPLEVRQACFDVIDRFYNPSGQRARIERAVDGESADDLWRPS